MRLPFSKFFEVKMSEIRSVGFDYWSSELVSVKFELRPFDRWADPVNLTTRVVYKKQSGRVVFIDQPQTSCGLRLWFYVQIFW